MTFILSAILDNLTTSIVMIMILRKLVKEKKDRIIYASLVIIAANSGGAFSPIGDVTTIMLWNKGLITAAGVIMEIFIPSLVSMVIPAYILSHSLKGELANIAEKTSITEAEALTARQRKTIFFLGVGGLIFVPIFKSITHLPPFVGILLVLGILWTVTEIFYYHLEEGNDKNGMQKRVTKMLSRIDMSTILFFLGILMAVACLETIGVLEALGEGLNIVFNGNHYLVTGIIGVLSSIVDNVPLVAGCMGMYPVAEVGDMAVDGIFWQLLAYCAGVGGSMLIVGSAAGVVVMGLEKISFGWYMKKITWIAVNGLLIADRCVCVNISAEQLDDLGFTKGKTISIDGQQYLCRLLKVGAKPDVPNEWDAALDATSDDNDLWHWEDVFFWGVEVVERPSAYRARRGYLSSRGFGFSSPSYRGVGVGFRPALKPLGTDNLKSEK